MENLLDIGFGFTQFSVCEKTIKIHSICGDGSSSGNPNKISSAKSSSVGF